MDNKYKLFINSLLSFSDKNTRLYNQYLFIAAQAIKINEKKIATKYYLEAFKIKRDLKSLIMCIISIFGSKLMIKLRYYFK